MIFLLQEVNKTQQDEEEEARLLQEEIDQDRKETQVRIFR